MSKDPCPFCGSKSVVLETPFVNLNDQGEYVPDKKFCCHAQRMNNEYVNKRFDPSRGDTPELDEVSKL